MSFVTLVAALSLLAGGFIVSVAGGGAKHSSSAVHVSAVPTFLVAAALLIAQAILWVTLGMRLGG